ncbi:hypothetical protein AB3N62_14395 [Leptospira sp. WS4.C2]
MDIYFNELSLGNSVILKDKINEGMIQFIKTFQSSSKYGFTKIRFAKGLDEILLSEDYSLKNWIYDGRRDNLRTLLLGVSVKPFIDEKREKIVSEFIDTKVEVELEDKSYKISLGIFGAYLSQSIAIGFVFQKYWERVFLAIRIYNGEEVALNETIPNIYSPNSIQQFDVEMKIYLALKKEIESMEDFLDKVSEIFPQLFFCDNAKEQLYRISVGDMRFNNLLKKLIRLNSKVSSWLDGGFDFKNLGIECSPDSPERIKKTLDKRSFLCPDGRIRVFSLHLKWSIGKDEVRLYFFPDPENRKIYIGYIGNKSGIGF